MLRIITILLFALTAYLPTSYAQQRDTFPTYQDILAMKVEMVNAGKYLDKTSGTLTIGAIVSTIGIIASVYGIVQGGRNYVYAGAGINVLGIVIMATTAGPLTKAGKALQKGGKK